MFAQAENFDPQNLHNVLWFWYGVHMYGPVGIRRGCPGTRIWNETSQFDCPQTFMVCALGSGNVCDEAFARQMTLTLKTYMMCLWFWYGAHMYRSVGIRR